MAQDDYTKLQLRVPKELHAKVQASAEKAGKSLNAELIHRIEESFASQERIVELESVNAALAGGAKNLRREVNYHRQLLSDAGGFISMLIEFEIAQKTGGKLSEFEVCVQKFGNSAAIGDARGALVAIGELDAWAKKLNIYGEKGPMMDAYRKIRQASLPDEEAGPI